MSFEWIAVVGNCAPKLGVPKTGPEPAGSSKPSLTVLIGDYCGFLFDSCNPSFFSPRIGFPREHARTDGRGMRSVANSLN